MPLYGTPMAKTLMMKAFQNYSDYEGKVIGTGLLTASHQERLVTVRKALLGAVDCKDQNVRVTFTQYDTIRLERVKEGTFREGAPWQDAELSIREFEQSASSSAIKTSFGGIGAFEVDYDKIIGY